MSRILATVAVFAVLAAPAAARSHGGAPTPWAQAEIKVVVAHGLMAKSVQTFHPNDPLTRGALTALVFGLTAEPATASTHSQAPVTIAQLDATLVRGLGLNVAAGALVLSGVLHPSGSVDRMALRWHAGVWDLWFLVWGILLAVATVSSWRQNTSRRAG